MITIEYSSPAVKGRNIFGGGDDFLVPYGVIWRTGANEATTFSTQEDIQLDTFNLPKGKYALFTLPNEDSWEIIFNEEWNQWGTYDKKDSLDVVRLFVTPTSFDSTSERMIFTFRNQALTFSWDKIGWSVPISSNE